MNDSKAPPGDKNNLADKPLTNDTSAAIPPINDVDASLVARACRELPYRTRAYEALMRKYERLLFSVCYRMLNNRADAEDACQDVMLKVYATLSRFEGRSSFKTWMMRVATNTCLTAIDKKKRRRDGRTRWSDETSGDHVTFINTANFDVATLLDTVRPEDREVLTLRYIADLSLQEIADATELTLSAAKMRLYRATEQLQAKVAAAQAHSGESTSDTE